MELAIRGLTAQEVKERHAKSGSENTRSGFTKSKLQHRSPGYYIIYPGYLFSSVCACRRYNIYFGGAFRHAA